MFDKAHINLSVDAEIAQKAKQAQINISALTEDAIRKKLGEKIVQANETLICEFCRKEGYKETADIVEPETNTKEPVKHPNALTWLCPDEKWICNSCLRIKSRAIPASI